MDDRQYGCNIFKFPFDKEFKKKIKYIKIYIYIKDYLKNFYTVVIRLNLLSF